MKIKVYYCDSVESAIRQARQELGVEAMLLESKPAPPEQRHLGSHEVVFVTPERTDPAAAAPAPPTEPEWAELARGIDSIRRLLHGHRQTSYLAAGRFVNRPVLADIYQELIANDVDAEFAAQLVAGLTGSAERGAGRKQLEQDLAAEVATMVAVAPEIGRPNAWPVVAAFMGPTGAGKTTTIAKLAFRLGLERKQSVRLLSIDNYRVGGADQLQAYASLLGVTWTYADDIEELRSLLDDVANGHVPRSDLVLVDTPGLGPTELAERPELARFLSERSDIDIHLVLNAATQARALRRLIDAYSGFGPHKLLFTRLDEALSSGPVLNEAIRTRHPLSFLGLGPKIPEDLAAASGATAADLLFGRPLRSWGQPEARA